MPLAVFNYYFTVMSLFLISYQERIIFAADSYTECALIRRDCLKIGINIKMKQHAAKDLDPEDFKEIVKRIIKIIKDWGK